MRAAVLGCGCVGLELTCVLAADGHDVWGVRRSDDGSDAAEATGVEAVRADVTDADSPGMVPDADHIVSATSSGGRGADVARAVFIEGLRTAIDQLATCDSPPERLVYTSSMSVCGDYGGDLVDESMPLDPTADKTRVLAEAERVACEYAAERGVEGTVTRFAGLCGPDRYRLERYSNGPVTVGCLNTVHQDNAAGAVASLFETGRTRDDTVFTIDDEPVSKHKPADWLADECGVPRPEKRTKEERLDAGGLLVAARRRILMSKCCSNDYLHELGYSFAYPMYRGGYRAAIDAYRIDGD